MYDKALTPPSAKHCVPAVRRITVRPPVCVHQNALEDSDLFERRIGDGYRSTSERSHFFTSGVLASRLLVGCGPMQQQNTPQRRVSEEVESRKTSLPQQVV